MRFLPSAACAILLTAWLATPVSTHAQTPGEQRFEVTITNVTRDQTFTPVFVATHIPELKLFQLGRPALPEVAIVAEEGDVAPLMALARNPAVFDMTFTGPPPGGFIPPGQSRTLTVRTRSGFDHVTVIAMLIPTNDGFFGLNGVPGPASGVVTYTSPAYDAGSERNDERCSSIPGPNFAECGGPGGGARIFGGEGYVHIHSGIQGVGDFRPSRDWRNPVAQITIRRVP